MSEAYILLGVFVFIIIAGSLIIKSEESDDVLKFIGAFSIAGGMIGLLTIPFVLAAM